jgi:CHAT domain-containing protein/TolA-binding protein
VAWRRGALDAAKQYFINAYEIHSAAQPDSLLAAGDLTMLGHVASNMKNFRKADQYYFQSLAITEKLFPHDETVPNTLMGLGNSARRQFNLDAARNYHTRAMQLYEKLGAKQRLTLALSNLGNVEFDAGRLREAAELYHQSLALRAELGAKESLLAPLHFNIGNVLRRQGKLSEARVMLRQVLDSFRESAPGSLEVQSTLFALAEVELDNGDAGAAKTYLVEALALAERLAPGTLYEVEPLHRLGKVALTENNPDRARALFFRAIDAFESQRKLVGGNGDTQRDFTAAFAYLYKDLFDLLVRLEEQVEAFDVSERYRSRVLMATVLGRAQDIERPMPPAIQVEWRQAHEKYDAALSALMNSASSSDAELAEKMSQLDARRAERDALIARYRTLNSRRATFEYPAPVSVRRLTERLPDNVALLSYLIADDGVYLFVLRRSSKVSVQVIALQVDPVTLADDVNLFVDLLRLRSPNAELLRTQWHVASDLYNQLIGPVAHLLRLEDRLIVFADGPLHALPFAALTTNAPGADAPHFLIEERALQFAPSLDWLLATAKHHIPNDGAVAVFADPRLDSSPASGPAVITRSNSFPPLPGARSEARAIARLFPNTQTFLGKEATESNAKLLSGNGVGVLHFATHGVLNLERPMESFLLLRSGETSGTHENGLLQAGEIAEQLDLPQALVVLSACSTGSGRLAGGEGIVGLGSAFLYAGASDVVSTLWSVSDDSTGQLMTEFYRAMRRGQSPSDALRAAQVFMIHAARDQDQGVNAWLSRLPIFTRGSSHSLNTNHWAAFRLHGQL